MANISSVNGILCVDIGGVNSNAKIDISAFDSIAFCAASPTPTPTNTPTNTPTPQTTPTPTPTPCAPGCCYVEICEGPDCFEACSCVSPVGVYLSIPCSTDPCTLANATGIFQDDRCGTPVRPGYYSDGSGCWYWDGSSSLSFQGDC